MTTVQDLYDMIAKAETGGETNPFIRTRVAPPEGSSAYGPAQITKTLAEDFLKRNPDLFSKEEKTYLKRFIAQGVKFLRYGKEPNKKGYEPRFDYGGEGELTSEEDKELYNKVARKMISYTYTKNNEDIEATLREWRFGASKKTLNKAEKEDLSKYIARADVGTESSVKEGGVLTAPLVDIESEVAAAIQRQLAAQNVAQAAPETVSQPVEEVAEEVTEISEEDERIVQQMLNELQGIPAVQEEGEQLSEEDERIIEQMMLEIQHRGLASEDKPDAPSEQQLIEEIYG